MPEKHRNSSSWVPLTREPKQRNPLVFKPSPVHKFNSFPWDLQCPSTWHRWSSCPLLSKPRVNLGVDDKMLSSEVKASNIQGPFMWEQFSGNVQCWSCTPNVEAGCPFPEEGKQQVYCSCPSETKAIKIFLSWKHGVGAILGHTHYWICYSNFDGVLLKVFESAFPWEGKYPALVFLVLFWLSMVGKGQLQLSNLASFLWKRALDCSQ